MSIVTERIALVAKHRLAVQEHCMCARLIETDHNVTVLYPDGYYPNGARISFNAGKADAFAKLAEVMERHWQDSLWWLDR